MKLRCLQALKDAVINAPVDFEYGGVRFALTLHVRLLDEQDVTAQSTGSDKDAAKHLIVGWDDFIDNDNAVPFSQETLDEMLVYPAIAHRLATECFQAQYRVQEKN